MQRLPLLLAAATLISILAGTPAAATTYLMVSDADLAAQAQVIAVVRVLGSEPARGAGGLPATAWRVTVEEALKGGAAVGEVLTVQVPGGRSDGAVGYRVWGAPRFVPGGRALLFLEPRPDGAFGVLHLMLGAFHELAADGRRIALRDLSEAREVVPRDDGSRAVIDRPADLPRDFDAFTAWLAAGAREEPRYFLEEEDLGGGLASRFTYLLPSDGHPIRWFEFDRGGAVPWQADGRGQTGLAGGGFAEFRTALGAWTDDPGSSVRYTWSGTTASTQTSCAPPRQTGKVVFDDPHGDISGSYSCGSGGVLAHGGPCYETRLVPHNGQSVHPAVDAFITTNDGIGCFFQTSRSPARAAEELFAHELGHTLGLGHTPVAAALMFAYIHDDGRGASLHSDDRAGIAALYGNGGGPPPPGPGPAAPTQLQATALGPGQARLSWRDNSNDEASFRLERRTGGGLFQEFAAVAADVTEHWVVDIAAGTRYEFRVRARNAEGPSGYSNVAAVTTPAGPVLPAAPSHLAAEVLSATEVRLSWRDNSSDEASFRVELAGFGDFREVALLGAGATSHTLRNLEPAALYRLRVRARNAAGFSPYSPVVTATTPGLPGPCVANAETLCLLDGAIRVQVAWRNQHAGGRQGQGRSVAGTRESGSFWFFSGDNLELVVKAIDGGGVNGHYWLFYGALSDVEYWVRVTRTATGEAVVYHNPPGDICGRGDIRALTAGGTAVAAGEPATATDLAAFSLAAPAVPASPPVSTRAGACVPDGSTLCLLDGRFAVQVDWTNQRNGATGVGGALPWADRTGFFWFFSPDKLELVTKALDGRGVNGRFWFFYGALSDVQYRITVTDTVTGAVRHYDNPAGEICGDGDTAAF